MIWTEPPSLEHAASVPAIDVGAAVAKVANRVAVCRVINSETQLLPAADADDYARAHKPALPTFFAFPNGTYRLDTRIGVVTPPRHGTVVLPTAGAASPDPWQVRYVPHDDYAGRDRFTVSVEVNGAKVLVGYVLHVYLPGEPTYDLDDAGTRVPTKDCPADAWKISLAQGAAGSGHGSWMRQAQLFSSLAQARN